MDLKVFKRNCSVWVFVVFVTISCSVVNCNIISSNPNEAFETERLINYTGTHQKFGKILTGPSRPNYEQYYPNSPNNGNYNNANDLTVQGSGNTQSVQHHPSLSSIDMQLLKAMEKLVSRMDSLDTRVKTLENIVHHLTEQKVKVTEQLPKEPEKPSQGPCPDKFVKIDGIRGKCFYFSSLSDPKTTFDWQSSAGTCQKLGGRLAEMLNFDDYHRIVKFMGKYNIKSLTATDFWTGGLNPGLIWLWSESGHQIDLDKRFWNENDNSSKIPGCLKLSYSTRLNTYFFKGAPCSQSQNVICEILDNSVARALALFEKDLFSNEEYNL